MDSFIPLPALALCFFLGMLGMIELGRRLGMRRLARDPYPDRVGSGAVEGAVFALFGLLIAFTFSGAASRFDSRRVQVVEEANDIGTAYLRIDLLPVDVQPKLREKFKQYLDSRLETYHRLPNLVAAMEAHAVTGKLQTQIWNETVAACRSQSDPAATTLVLTALNQMFDITTTRTMAGQIHPPSIIFILLLALGLSCSLLAGYGMAGSKTRSWVHMLGFAAVMSVTVYVILDIEYPRLGLIRVDAIDQVLVDLRKSMR